MIHAHRLIRLLTGLLAAAALAACATAPATPSPSLVPGAVRSRDFLWDSGGFTLGRAQAPVVVPAPPSAPGA